MYRGEIWSRKNNRTVPNKDDQTEMTFDQKLIAQAESMEIPNKREIQQITFNHLSDIDFQGFMNLY